MKKPITQEETLIMVTVMEILVMTEVILLKGGEQIGLEEEGVEVECM